MPIEKLLPSILLLIQVMAGFVYIVKGNVALSVYWIAAAVLTLAVTWL